MTLENECCHGKTRSGYRIILLPCSDWGFQHQNRFIQRCCSRTLFLVRWTARFWAQWKNRKRQQKISQHWERKAALYRDFREDWSLI